ncbi:retrovirus-related Pol polyprotein from transposon 297 [Trichonephila clavipes]|uniref:Retrovirus-related Pol polyprotein from transposon 297 n=1 Tax=Trichonephila clavipes TaxID=2585209 RepID=A0A8X6W8D3_TRICX|nr:retrovirus-related Pol polyprotein from transposon 297 [Trichonephila clavipes]
MGSIINECSETVLEVCEKHCEIDEPVDCKRVFGAFTMDVIASSAFGTKIDSHNDPDNEFVSRVRKAFLDVSFFRMMLSRNRDNGERRGWNERKTSNADYSRKNWRNLEVVRRPSIGRNVYSGNYENGHQGNQWFDSRNRFQKDDRRINGRGYQFRNGGQKDDFSRGDRRNRGSNKPGLTDVLYQEIDTGDKPPVISRPYDYDRIKQAIFDYHVEKMLKEGTIFPIQSPNASPVVLYRKNNGLSPNNLEAYRFAVDYWKLNAITKYPRYPLPLIDDLIMIIPHTTMMSTLDLRSGYFQLAVNPSDIVKTVFVTKNGTYAFRRMPFCLSGVAPNFQKARDIILKPVIGNFVNVYMDDVIRSSPSFTQYIVHLREVFRLLQDAGLTLSKDKCKFGCNELKYYKLNY